MQVDVSLQLNTTRSKQQVHPENNINHSCLWGRATSCLLYMKIYCDPHVPDLLLKQHNLFGPYYYLGF